MSFTQNWFEILALKNFQTLKNIIDINKPINVLEIGCFQGNCHLWLYENILIHPDSKSEVIDPFEKSITHSDLQHPNTFDIFCNNLYKYKDKITIHKGFSDDILPTLEKNSFDIIYIDGDHSSLATYNDGVNSFTLLKKGGIMIFDDYLWNGLYVNDNMDIYRIGGELNPCRGINKFLSEYSEKYELLKNFDPPITIIDIDELYENNNISQQELFNNVNYQILIIKK